jgi:hypothetical protein
MRGLDVLDLTLVLSAEHEAGSPEVRSVTSPWRLKKSSLSMMSAAEYLALTCDTLKIKCADAGATALFMLVPRQVAQVLDDGTRSI